MTWGLRCLVFQKVFENEKYDSIPKNVRVFSEIRYLQFRLQRKYNLKQKLSAESAKEFRMNSEAWNSFHPFARYQGKSNGNNDAQIDKDIALCTWYQQP